MGQGRSQLNNVYIRNLKLTGAFDVSSVNFSGAVVFSSTAAFSQTINVSGISTLGQILVGGAAVFSNTVAMSSTCSIAGALGVKGTITGTAAEFSTSVKTVELCVKGAVPITHTAAGSIGSIRVGNGTLYIYGTSGWFAIAGSNTSNYA